MTDANAAAPPAPAKRGLSMMLLLAIGVVMLAAGGGGAWFFMNGKEKQAEKPAEAPLPFTLAIKPFVVSIPSTDGASHFVQFGPNLQLPNSSAGDVVNSVLPQIQDAMRETLLSFKTDDLQTVEGINKMRAAMVKRVNKLLTQVLGQSRVKRMTGGEDRGELVENIFFPTLVVE